ncbi:gliding motility-associated C-terminal domain-containing protein [Chitinophaga sp.]|uniref:Ig-like domain-containing protein n=1 Tax=Chitinophaga sp. TaxID=1869181 RepID=UPI0031DFDC8F
MGNLLLLLMTFGMIAQPAMAQTQTQRVYANSEAHATTGLCLICSVANPDSARDVTGNFLQTGSVINAGVAALATIYQEVIFPAGQTPSATDPAIVKIGTGGTLLSLGLASAIKVQAYNGSTPVGTPANVAGTLLNLLVSGNQAEVFVPAPGAAYDRVRVTIDAGLLSAALSLKVYAAYYNKPATGTIACNTPIDVLTGATADLGLASLGGVTNAQNAIDNNISTYATMQTALAAAGQAQITAIYPGLSKTGDSVRVVVSNPGTLLTLQLLNSITILTYNGGTVVDSIPGNSNLLRLDLLQGSGSIQTLSFASSGPFDHIQVRFGAIVSALAALNIHEIQRLSPAPVSAGGVLKTTCLGTDVVLNVSNPDNVNYNYTWYDSTQTNIVGTGSSFTASGATAGSFRYYVSAMLKTCSASESAKALVTVQVNKYATAADITVPPTTAVCANVATITPSATNPSGTPTFKWYKDINKTTQITNGLVEGAISYAIDAAGKLTITGLTAPSTTFYVSITDSTHCENQAGALAAAIVTVGTSPVPPVTATGVSAVVNQPITLTASAPAGTIEWYTDTTLAAVATGPSYNIGSFPTAGVHTYFVGVRLPGGCSSARIRVDVTVTTGGAPVSCNAPTTSAWGTTLGCVLCAVNNPNNAVDSDPTNFSQLSVPVGLLGGSAFEQLIFPQPGAATDSVRFDLEFPDGLANVSLLGGVVLTVANGTNVVTRDTLGSLLHISLLSSTRGYVTIPAVGAFDRVEVKMTGTLNLLNTVNIYGARIISPNPTALVRNVKACLGSTATLSATVAPGTSIQWFADSTTTTVLSSSNPFTTPVLNTPGTITYWAQVVGTNNCANPDRIPVVVTVNTLGTAADINLADTTLGCVSNTAVLKPTSTTVTNPVFTWYKDANKTTAITNGLTEGAVHYALDSVGNLTVTGLALGNYTYYVAVTGSNRCENAAGALKPAVVSIVNAPASPVVTGTVVVATGQQATLTASPVPGAVINWYADSTTTTIAGTGTSFVVGPFNNPGTYSYFAAVSVPGACSSARVRVDVVVTGPVIPSPDCNVPTSQVSGTTLGCILCSVQNPTNDIDSSKTNFTTLSVPVGLLGGAVYQQLIFPNPGAAGDSIRLTMAAPGGLADVSLFGGIVITQYNGATAVKADTLANLLTLRLLSGQQFNATVGATGTYDRVEVRLTGTLNLLNAIDIYGARVLYPNPTISGTGDTVCVNQKATLSVTPAAGTTVRWYADSTSTTVLSSQNTYTTDTLRTPGKVTYFVQVVGANNCANPDRIPVTVVVNPLSTAADINLADTTHSCVSGAAMLKPTSTTVTNPVFTWYKDANKTTPITNGLTEGAVHYALDSVGNLTITGLALGNYTYYVAVSGAGRCENAAGALKPAVVNVVNAPASPVVTGTVVVATGQQATLTASPVPGAVINWYADSTTTTIAGTGTSFVVGPFNNPGTYSYFAAVSVPGACSSARVRVDVVVTGPVIPSPDCNVPTSQVSGTTLGCILCSVQDPTNDIDSSKTNFTRLSVPVGLLGGSVYQQLIFPNPGAASDSIRLTMAAPGGLADVSLFGGIVITQYNGATAVKADTLANLLTLRLLSGQQFNATVGATGTYDRVEVRLTGTLNLLNAIDIYGARKLYPNPTISGTGDTVCVNQKATLSVTPAAGTTVRWYADSTSTTVLSSQNTYTTDTLRTPGKVTYYVQVVGANNCANPDRIPVTVTVSPAPLVPGTDQTLNLCPGTSAALAVSNPNSQLTYNWYNVATGGTKLNTDSGYVFNVPNITKDTTFYVEAMSACGTVSPRQAFHIVISASLSAPVVTPNPDSVNIGTQAVLKASSNAANVTFTWYGSQAGNDSLFTGPTYAPPTQNTPGTVTYWVKASISGSCSSIRVPVVVVYGQFTTPTQVPCEGATTQTIGGSGLLVLGNVYNPQLAVDNDASTYSSLVINLGVLNAEVWEKAGFNGLSAPGDTVRVLLSDPSVVLSASLLGGVQLTTYNGNAPQDSVTVSDPLVKLSLLSNGTQAIAEFVPAHPFDAVQVKLKSGLVGALTEIGFNYAQRALAKPAVQASQVAVCSGNTATLNVQNPAAGVTYRWYTSNGTYLTGKDGTSLTTGALTSDTSFFVEAYRNGCASTARTQVAVKVAAAPVAPTVQSNDVKVCPGSDAVLAIATPLAGYTYNWYNVATGGTKLNTDSGFTYKVVNVTAPATYYVEAVNDSCNTISATRTAVNVSTAASLPDPTVTPNPDTVVVNQQPVFTASASTANAQFYWFATQTSTDTLFKGAQYAAPASATIGTVTYWVVAAVPGAGSCTSARIPVTAVTISDRQDPVPCEGASSFTIGGSGLLVLGNVYNPQLAVDQSANTYSSLVIDLGVLNASVWERAYFNGVSTPGDTVKVMVTNPSQVLSAAVLASLQLTAYNGNTAVDSVLVSNPLVNLNLLSGGRSALLSFVPTQPFTGVEVKLKSGIVGALTELGFNYAQRAIVQPTVQVTNANICKGQQATINVVNPVAGVTYGWYDSHGNHLLDSIAYVTPPTLDSGTYTYTVRAMRNNCSGAASLPATVTVYGTPATPVATKDSVTTCLNTPVTLSVNAVPGVNFNWYDAATGGAKLASNTNTYTTPSNLGVGTYKFYVEAVNGNNCTNAAGTRAVITLTVTTASTAADINVTDQTICAGDTAVLTPTSTTVVNPVFKWYANPDKTGPITQGVSATGVLSVSGLAPGTYTYYVSVSSAGNCENAAGDLKAAHVTVNKRSTAADIILNDTKACAKTTVTLTAATTTVTNPVFKWYQDANLQTLLFTGPSYTTGLITANTTYYVTVEGSNSCANAAGTAKAVNVNITSLQTPTVTASNTNICAGDSVVLSVQNPVNTLTYRWYNVATGGTALFTGPVYIVRNLTVSTDFYVEASAGSCTDTTRVKISIGVGTAPTPVLVSDNVTTCTNTPAILMILNPDNALTYNWYTTPTGGTPVFTGQVFTTPPLTTTTQYYVEAVGDPTRCGAASPRATATVTVVTAPPAPVVTPAAVNTCSGSSVTLTVQNPQPGVNYQWNDVAGNLVFTGTSYTFTADSTTTYYVRGIVGGTCPRSCGGCPGPRTAITVTVNAAPATPTVAATSLNVCAGGTVTLSIQNPVAGTTYNWYDAATGGTLLGTGNTYTTNPLSVTTDFYAEASNGNCTSVVRAKVTVSVGTAPTPVLESNALTICTGSTATLRVTSPVNNITYNWYTVPTGGTPVFTGPVYTTLPLTASTDFYVEAVGDPALCGNPSARVKATVTVTSAPAAPDVTATSLRTCAGTGVTVSVKNAQPGFIYQWYDAPVGGTLLFTGEVYNIPAVNNTTTYYVQANIGTGCSSATRTAVVVNVDPAPAMPTVASNNLTICIGGNTTFSIQAPDPALTYNWYDAPTNGTLLATGPSFTTGALNSTTTFYVVAKNNNGCASSSVSVTATVITTIDAPLADPITTCAGQTVTLAVKNSVAGVIYKWYTQATGGTPVFTGANYTITPGGNATYYLEAATSGGCVSASRTAVNVTVNAAPAVPVVANATLQTCQGQTVTLSVQNPDATLTYKWYTTATGGTAISTGSSFTTPPVTANAMYYVEAVNATGCPSATRTAVSVQLISAPAAPTVTGNENGICPGKSATLTAGSTTAGVTFNWYTTPTGGTPVFTGPVFTTPALNTTTTYYVEAASPSGGCVGIGARTAVIVSMLQPLAAPHVSFSNITATSVTFTWNAVPGAVRYEVTLDGGATFSAPSTGPSGTSHTVNNLQPNQTLNFGVRAIGASDCETSGLGTLTCTTSNPQGNNIFIPNLFSPNGDGVNDVLYVYGTAIAQLEFRVYNQWGQLVFTSKDQRQGWDGTMSGQKQPVGVYVYIVRATMQDGQVITKKGNVTLMR